jgi:hypothetical protein
MRQDFREGCKMLRMEAGMAEEAVSACSHKGQKRGSSCVKYLGLEKSETEKEWISSCRGSGVKAQGSPGVLANTCIPCHSRG